MPPWWMPPLSRLRMLMSSGRLAVLMVVAHEAELWCEEGDEVEDSPVPLVAPAVVVPAVPCLMPNQAGLARR